MKLREKYSGAFGLSLSLVNFTRYDSIAKASQVLTEYESYRQDELFIV